METHGVGMLVVVEGDRPIGVVTDRDLALGVLGRDLDPREALVGDLMTEPAATIEEDRLWEASEVMRDRGIRRLPVVNGEGRLVGVITADDLLLSVGERSALLAAVVRRELTNESYTPPASIFGKE